ncbi:hypothetical protein BD414DRAFT_518273 [Trametes punicea]|nr:hypothetical protein BD414DRAFT_518273 [Trametes punicea]
MDVAVKAATVPDWLETHPELQGRGILLTDCIKPACVFRTSPFMDVPQYVVKLLSNENDYSEARIYERLCQHRHPRNHTLPSEILDVQTKPILLLPCLSELYDLGITRWTFSRLLEIFLQVVEGVEYMHQQRIAHGDICIGNIVVATERDAKMHNEVIAGRLYIIDFETSRQLNSSPGVQHALPLPQSQCRPPSDMDQFDPYSWDVYCLGKLFEYMAEMMYRKRPQLPWVVRLCQIWLIGDEKGCKDVYRCRPTARRARQFLSVLRWFVVASERCEELAAYARSFLSPMLRR